MHIANHCTIFRQDYLARIACCDLGIIYLLNQFFASETVSEGTESPEYGPGGHTDAHSHHKAHLDAVEAGRTLSLLSSISGWYRHFITLCMQEWVMCKSIAIHNMELDIKNF